MKRFLVLLLALLSCIPGHAELLAQQDTRPVVTRGGRDAVALRLVPGFGYTSATFGDDDPRSEGVFGLTFGGQALLPFSRFVALSLEAIFQPYEINNPHLNEGFRTWYLMGGIELGAGKIYLRPNVGLGMRLWSGGGGGTGAAPALGLAVGFEQMLGKSFHVSPEVISRVAYEHGASSVLIGIQVPLGWRMTGGD